MSDLLNNTKSKIIDLEMRIKELEQEKKIQMQHIKLLLTSSLPKTKYIEEPGEVLLPHYCLNGHVPNDTKLLISKIELEPGEINPNDTKLLIKKIKLADPLMELKPGEIIIEGQSGREIYANGVVVKNGEVYGIFYKN